jgi:hypothetical protein
MRVLGTSEYSCTARLARLFFIFKAHDPQETAEYVMVAPEPSR